MRLVLGRAEKLAELLNPFIMAFYSIPKIALAPLFIIWVFIVWVFTGLRLSVPYAMIGAIVGEMIAANRGLGCLPSRASSQFNTAGVFAALVAIITMSVLLNMVVSFLARVAMPWEKPRRGAKSRSRPVIPVALVGHVA
ncbi:ABC transporter permease subunit [uncultured Roseovarius sp.]|uniref:ABC transporter permease n=1 Tax=uncultured Roseovarius sp. TaxID=293344 RepID=UPI00259AE851|nr:ABC transporter permease subunit [uncultured Roseovarius sp.]